MWIYSWQCVCWFRVTTYGILDLRHVTLAALTVTKSSFALKAQNKHLVPCLGLYISFSLCGHDNLYPSKLKLITVITKNKTTTTKQHPKTGILCSSSHPIKHSFATVVENVEPSSVTQHIPCSETQKDKVTQVKPTWENKTKGLALAATSNFLFLGRNFSGENRNYSAWYSLHLDAVHKTKRVNHYWGREFFWGITSVSRKGVITSVLRD